MVYCLSIIYELVHPFSRLILKRSKSFIGRCNYCRVRSNKIHTRNFIWNSLTIIVSLSRAFKLGSAWGAMKWSKIFSPVTMGGGGSTKFVETKKLGMRGGGALENKHYLPVKVKMTVKVENRSIKVELNLPIFLGLHFW